MRLPTGYKKRKDGTLECRFTYEGVRYSVYGKTTKECEIKKDERKAELKANAYTKNKDITVKAYFKEWERQRVGTVKKSTEINTRRMLNNIEDIIGNVKVAKLERRQVIDLQTELAKKLTTAGVNNHISILKTVMNSAIADRIIVFNPCMAVKPLKRVEEEAKDTNHRALEIWEQELFFEYAKGYWYYELYAFLVLTGVRTGEASALTWNDIDYTNNVIHITKTVTKTGNNEYSVGDSPKTKAGIRDIPLTEQAKGILARQREKVQAFNGGNVIDLSGRIFKPQRNNKLVIAPTIESNLKCIFEKMRKDGNEIDYFSPHCFRDTFATRCIEQGMTYKTLQTIMGHSSLKMTMDLYAHVLPNTKMEEMKTINMAI